MWRGLLTLLTVWIAYGCGHPALDGYRPAWLDRPLQSLHENVNASVMVGRHAIASLETTRPVRYLKDSVASATARLRSTN
jgi:hypothetical protein